MVKLRCQEIRMMRWVLSSRNFLRVNNQWERTPFYIQQPYSIRHLVVTLQCKLIVVCKKNHVQLIKKLRKT